MEHARVCFDVYLAGGPIRPFHFLLEHKCVSFGGFVWKFIFVAFIGCLSGIIWEFFRDSLGAYWESAMT